MDSEARYLAVGFGCAHLEQAFLYCVSNSYSQNPDYKGPYQPCWTISAAIWEDDLSKAAKLAAWKKQSVQATKNKFTRKNLTKRDIDNLARAKRLERAAKRPRDSMDTPIGRKITTDVFLKAFTDAFDWDRARIDSNARPIKPPHNLDKVFSTLTPDEQAMCVIAPLVDLAHRQWEDEEGFTYTAEAQLRADVGQHLHDRLAMKKRLKIEEEDIRDLKRRNSARRKGLTGKALEKERRLGAWRLRETKKMQMQKKRRRIAMTYLKRDWDPVLIAKGGEYLLDVAKSVKIDGRYVFAHDEDGFLKIADWIKPEFDRIRDELRRRDPVLEPHPVAPPAWTDFHMDYGDRLSTTFVRKARPETKERLHEAFRLHREFIASGGTSSLHEGTANRRPDSALEAWAHEALKAARNELEVEGAQKALDAVLRSQKPPSVWKKLGDLDTSERHTTGRDFEHARGVSALQRVPLLIDQKMVGLVERFGMKVLDHKRDKKGYADKEREDIRNRDLEIIAEDLESARRRADEPFHLTYRCDFRGRLYPVQRLNYAREDHGRSLFQFANGKRLGLNHDDLDWLEIHCASCYGKSGSWQQRCDWVKSNRELICDIAADSAGTVNHWYTLDKPFRFVAACRELAAAWANPSDFVTHLPLAFDGSCNAFQHYLLIGRIREGAELVNLIDHPEAPHDIYLDVIKRARSMIEDDKVDFAEWWRKRLRNYDEQELRKLLKSPVMTSGYGVQYDGVYNQLSAKIGDLTRAASNYMHDILETAGEEIIPGVKYVKDCVRGIQKILADGDVPMISTSPTGFPMVNMYSEPIIETRYYGGKEFNVAVGWQDDLIKQKAINASAPNFVHSLDAAHLIRVVNAAAEEGIDLVTVHDSYSFLAPQARRGNQLIREYLAMMYYQPVLRELYDENIGNPKLLPPPEYGKYGKLDLRAVPKSEYLFHP